MTLRASLLFPQELGVAGDKCEEGRGDLDTIQLSLCCGQTVGRELFSPPTLQVTEDEEGQVLSWLLSGSTLAAPWGQGMAQGLRMKPSFWAGAGRAGVSVGSLAFIKNNSDADYFMSAWGAHPEKPI